MPVDRVEVELTLGDGSSRKGTVFVPPGSQLAQLFRQSDRFVPIEEDGKVRLYAPGALACVATRVSADADPMSTAIPEERRAVRVHLRSGTVIDGEVRFVPWGDRVRTADLLNEASPTLEVHRRDGALCWVQKTHVEHVEEA
ncbi:MAG: hypothetical protein WKG00_14525 [Polyangiaceae bacterium]